jgi:hypothetical protein
MPSVDWTITDRLPEGILNSEADQLWHLLKQPTLIHILGDRHPPLFISVLLHGNETTGWLAVRQLLREYQGKTLPRSISLWIGNVSAARYGRRRLDHQPDYNRIWSGNSALLEARMAQSVVREMQRRGVFACVDLHNNTGDNPFYSCLVRRDVQSQYLASLFSPIALYYAPHTAQPLLVNAFAELAPAVLLECGKPDRPAGTERAYAFLRQVLQLEAIPAELPCKLSMLQAIATIKIPPHIQFGFTAPADLVFLPQIDRYNFGVIPQGTAIARVSPQLSLDQCLQVCDHNQRDVSQQFFQIVENRLVTTTSIQPAMLTLDPLIIRQDCFCYLMASL